MSYADIQKHVANEQQKAGFSPAATDLIRHIIYLRRQIDVDQHWSAFERLVSSNLEALVAELDYRWLNSLTDTYIDHGTDLQKAQAMVLSQYHCTMKALRITSTISSDNVVRKPTRNLVYVKDKFAVMFERMDATLTLDPFKSVWVRLRKDLDSNHTDWRRISRSSYNGFYRKMRWRADVDVLIDCYCLSNAIIIGQADDEFMSHLTKPVRKNGNQRIETVATKGQLGESTYDVAYVSDFRLVELDELLKYMTQYSFLISCDYSQRGVRSARATCKRFGSEIFRLHDAWMVPLF